jgi:hypothetical protein
MQVDLLLPRTLLVAVRLEALPAFVLRHLQTTFLLQVTHGERVIWSGNVRVRPRSVQPEFNSHRPAEASRRIRVKTTADSTADSAKPVNLATAWR